MKTLVIDPITIQGESKSSISERRGFTYLHGELMRRHGYDCFAVVPPFNWHSGVYNAYILGYEDEASTFYLWMGSDSRLHGLVVFNSDTEANEYAKKCYENKTTVL